METEPLRSIGNSRIERHSPLTKVDIERPSLRAMLPVNVYMSIGDDVQVDVVSSRYLAEQHGPSPSRGE